MPAWSDVLAATPQLASLVQQRFEAHGLGFLATLRRDGAPRLSGIEPLFAHGELWLGMMPGSRKAADLLRDPRFALHNATVDKDVVEGDAKISGRAILEEEPDALARHVEAFRAKNGYAPPPGPCHLFRANVEEVARVQPVGGAYLEITWWRAGGPTRRIERR